jgi:hypothetical protein
MATKPKPVSKSVPKPAPITAVQPQPNNMPPPPANVITTTTTTTAAAAPQQPYQPAQQQQQPSSSSSSSSSQGAYPDQRGQEVLFHDQSLADELKKQGVALTVSPLTSDQVILSGPKTFMYDLPKALKEAGKFSDLFDGWQFPTQMLVTLERELSLTVHRTIRKMGAPNQTKYKDWMKLLKEKFNAERNKGPKPLPTHVLVAEMIPGARGKYARICGIVPFNMERERELVYRLADNYLIGLTVKHMTLSQFGEYERANAIRSTKLGELKAEKDTPHLNKEEKEDLSQQLDESTKIVDYITESTFDDKNHQ